MTSAPLPPTAPQRPPMSRAKRELIIALAALPVLLAAGVYVGGRISDRGTDALQPAAGVAAPIATVVASPPHRVATVPPRKPVARKPSPRAGGPLVPVVTPKPAAPSPVVTVKPPAPSPVVTVKPPAPGPVVTVKPPAPRPPVRAPQGSVAEPPAVPRTVLGRGSTGADVRAWQEQMARRTWRIRVDGIFGPESERVAREFQRIKGLRVDGLVGPETWAAAWRLRVLS